MIWVRSYVFLRQQISKLSTSCRCFAVKATEVAVKNNNSTEASAVKDIIMFKFESPRFFKFLNLFAITQYGFWMYIGISSLSMNNVPVREMSQEEHDATPFWRKVNLGSDKYKYGLALGSAFMGFGILFISWTYILRTVRYLVLRKDGKNVAFVTYTPFGRNRILNVPITDISAEGSRTSGSSQMPVRIKSKSLFYLVDLKGGKFIHPQLFDRTVGTKRKFR